MAETQCSYFFPNFRLICSYFVLVTIIIFDLALQICLYIIHAEYFWLFMAGLKETFYTLIFKFMYIIWLCCSWRFSWHGPDFIVKFLLSSSILFIHRLFVSSLNWLIYFSPLKIFWVLASSLVIALRGRQLTFLLYGPDRLWFSTNQNNNNNNTDLPYKHFFFYYLYFF